ncbi:MAG TPA: GntR family transcriptional regulator [Capsulimonadaceae bacterium]
MPHASPRHLHERLKAQMRDSLVATARPGDRLPPERDLARRFGVSTVTISRALKLLQDDGLVERVPGKGTFISHLGAGAPAPAANPNSAFLATASPSAAPLAEAPVSAAPLPYTWIITNLSEDPSERLSYQWTHRSSTALERAIQGAGGRTLFIDYGRGNDLHPFRDLDEAIAAGINSVALVDGIQDNDSHGKLIQQLMRHRLSATGPIPIVELVTGIVPLFPFESVRYDFEYGVSLAVAHLLKLGHTKIAFVGDLDQPWAKKRGSIYVTTLEAFGVEYRSLTACPVIFEAGSRSCLAWDKLGKLAAEAFTQSAAWNEATAVVALNDFVALSVQRACINAGRSVPETLSIIGFDDIAQTASAGITTVHTPVEETGEMAARLIQERLARPNTTGRDDRVLNPTLIVRSSTAKPRE